MQKSTTHRKAETLKFEKLKLDRRGTTHTTPRRRIARWAVGAAVALAGIPAALAQPSFFITELPVPAGYEACAAYQIKTKDSSPAILSAGAIGSPRSGRVARRNCSENWTRAPIARRWRLTPPG
jgi:hypothetical protein